MPYKPHGPCRRPGCPNLAVDKGYCSIHLPAYLKEKDAGRPSSNERGYNYRWNKVSKLYLQAHPLCVECRKHGRVVAAECVDHIKPHKGDMTLFWDENNWQALCLSCNSAKAAREEGAFGNKTVT